jgi:hypothetical protein
LVASINFICFVKTGISNKKVNIKRICSTTNISD